MVNNTSNVSNTGIDDHKVVKRGITGSTLKMIAMITMLIDHTSAILVYGMSVKLMSYPLYMLSVVMRWVGRLAFPIFCFLLVEGMLYTSNKGKYALRLLLFALISEVPFNLAFRGSVWAADYQNVFFTLFIGLLIMIGWNWARSWGKTVTEHTGTGGEDKRTWVGTRIVQVLVCFLILVLGMELAQILNTDYAAHGVLTIAVIYLVRVGKDSNMYRKVCGTIGAGWRNPQATNRTLAMVAGCGVLTIMNLSEAFAFIDVAMVAGYNGQRGWKLKYIFYVFYPLHLFVLYYISIRLGYYM